MKRLLLWLAALWWGGMTALSLLVVPQLFAQLSSPAQAGPMAAHLFSLQSWAVLGIGLALLLLLRHERSLALRLVDDEASGPDQRQSAVLDMQRSLGSMGFVLLAMLCALLQEQALAERIVHARASGASLALWHGLGSVAVLIQWLCGAALLWRFSAETPRPR